MQIYNEKIFDLLQDKRRDNPLQIRESENGGGNSVHVRGLSVFRVDTVQETMNLLKKGMRNRVVRSTDFNSESSRSHTVLQLFVTVEEENENGLVVGFFGGDCGGAYIHALLTIVVGSCHVSDRCCADRHSA
jgi:hypothetical protein